MRILILLVFLPFMGSAQSLSKDGQQVIMSIGEAARVDYWGRKGLQADPLISTLELNIKLLEAQEGFRETILENHRKSTGPWFKSSPFQIRRP